MYCHNPYRGPVLHRSFHRSPTSTLLVVLDNPNDDGVLLYLLKKKVKII